jgi:endonuclease/exonuclease/phosphatase family metal-dependent hydrolase
MTNTTFKQEPLETDASKTVAMNWLHNTKKCSHHYNEAYRIITFNIRFDFVGDGPNRWKFRSKGVCQKLASYQMDILCLQEVLQYQFDDIYAALNSNGLCYDAVTRGREKDNDPNGKEPNEHCSILFNTEKFTKISGGFFWLSSTPDVPGSKSWDADCVRMATWVILDSKKYTGGISPLLIVNTHWDHMGRTARLESAKLIKRKIIEISKKSPVPIGLTVFTGDLNCFSDSTEFQEMLEDEIDELTGFRLSFQNAREPSALTGTFTGWHDEVDIIIDHILISDHLKALPRIDYQVIEDTLPEEPDATDIDCNEESLAPKKSNPEQDNDSQLIMDKNSHSISVTPSSDNENETSGSNESPSSPVRLNKVRWELTHSPMPSEEVHSPLMPPDIALPIRKRRQSIPPTTSFSNLDEMSKLGYDASVKCFRKYLKKRKKPRKLSDHRPVLVTICI